MICVCDARFSGNDASEWCARGCPSCICHRKEFKEVLLKLAMVDQHLCERIIDHCGYDPEKESREDLIALVKSLSEENEVLLSKIRQNDDSSCF